jgi:hypothetical protein
MTLVFLLSLRDEVVRAAEKYAPGPAVGKRTRFGQGTISDDGNQLCV